MEVNYTECQVESESRKKDINLSFKIQSAKRKFSSFALKVLKWMFWVPFRSSRPNHHQCTERKSYHNNLLKVEKLFKCWNRLYGIHEWLIRKWLWKNRNLKLSVRCLTVKFTIDCYSFCWKNYLHLHKCYFHLQLHVQLMQLNGSPNELLNWTSMLIITQFVHRVC